MIITLPWLLWLHQLDLHFDYYDDCHLDYYDDYVTLF